MVSESAAGAVVDVSAEGDGVEVFDGGGAWMVRRQVLVDGFTADAAVGFLGDDLAAEALVSVALAGVVVAHVHPPSRVRLVGSCQPHPVQVWWFRSMTCCRRECQSAGSVVRRRDPDQ